MRCIIKSCKSDQDCKDPIVSYHRFPEFEMERYQWISALNLKPDDVTQRSIVCSLHFRDEDFLTDYLSDRSRLRPSAIPFLVDDSLSSNEMHIPDAGIESLIDDDVKLDGGVPFWQNLIELQKDTFAMKEVYCANTSNVNRSNFLREPYPIKSEEAEAEEKSSNNGISLATAIQSAKDLEAKLKALQKVLVEKDRIISTLHTKIRFKSKRISDLLKKVSKLKKKHKLVIEKANCQTNKNVFK